MFPLLMLLLLPPDATLAPTPTTTPTLLLLCLFLYLHPCSWLAQNSYDYTTKHVPQFFYQKQKSGVVAIGYFQGNKCFYNVSMGRNLLNIFETFFLQYLYVQSIFPCFCLCLEIFLEHWQGRRQTFVHGKASIKLKTLAQKFWG